MRLSNRAVFNCAGLPPALVSSAICITSSGVTGLPSCRPGLITGRINQNSRVMFVIIWRLSTILSRAIIDMIFSPAGPCTRIFCRMPTMP